MPNFILRLSETSKEDSSIVGGKAANLGELYNSAVNIPDGFTISTQGYFYFLKSTNLSSKIIKLLQKVDPNDSRILNEVSKLIKKAFDHSPIPDDLTFQIKEYYKQLITGGTKLVAVRSSAIHEDLPRSSFAGPSATFLNIEGEKQLLGAIKKCWASLYEPRAIFYRHERSYNQIKTGMAVVIQKMIQSDVSGVMFTIDPVENEKNKIVIEAAWGLGQLLVQGGVNPDHYEVAKKDFKIVSKQVEPQTKQLVLVGKQNKELEVAKAYQKAQKIPNEKIKELAKLGKKIENRFGFPQDIEWALYNHLIYIIQSRPITTIKEVEKAMKRHIQIGLPILLKGSPASPGIATGMPKVINTPKDLGKLAKGEILITSMTNPDFVPVMKKAAAIITDQNGRINHAEILSREMGLPCVVGTEKATRLFKNIRTLITVNGSEGNIYKGSLSQPRLAILEYIEKRKEELLGQLKTATKILVNLGEKELASQVAKKDVDGVGLLKSESLISEIGVHPRKIINDGKRKYFIQKLAHSILVFAQAFNPRPVIYRLSNFTSNEYKNFKYGQKFEEDEPNPQFGFRGAYRYINEPEIFEMELESLKWVRNRFDFHNIWLTIPFVRTLSELEKMKKFISSRGLYRSSTFKILMIAEIPSNVLLVDKFLDVGIDGILIGSSLLTTFLLAVDRNNNKITQNFNELDDSVLWSIERIIKECRKRKLYVGITGQASAIYPQLVEKLVAWGITSISVSPDSIEKTRQLVHQAEKQLISNR